MSNTAHHKSRLFHKGCLSLHSCQTAILSHVGALNSAYWAFSTFQSELIWAIVLVVLSSFSIWKEPWASPGRIWCLHDICLFPWESFSRHSLFISICGKTEQIRLVRNKDAVRYGLNSDSCMTILSHQLWEELLPWERTQWHWSKHVKFSPSVPQRLSFFAQLPNCNLVTCWRIEHSILGLLHLSISINLSTSFSCSIKFFNLKRALG